MSVQLLPDDLTPGELWNEMPEPQSKHDEAEIEEVDLKGAVRTYEMSAEVGCVDGIFSHARCLMEGVGVEKDEERALALYERCAECGFAPAQCEMALIKLEGKDNNPDEGIRFFKRAALQGSAEALCYLGICYLTGNHVERNLQGGMQFLEAAAEQGLAEAQCNLGKLHEKAGEMIDAMCMYGKAANQGNEIAQFKLAGCYKKGVMGKPNLRDMVKWYKLSAQQGYALAQERLAFCHKNGVQMENYSLPKNPEEAVRLYRLAANQNLASAQCALGRCYELGEGVEKSLSEALTLYRRAAKRSHPSALLSVVKLSDEGLAMMQYELAACLEEGKGMEKDVTEAKKLYEFAAD